MSPPLALGLAAGGAERAPEWQRLLALAERADALGLHSFWLPEGHFRPAATPSPLLVLAAVAARTRALRLATTSVLLSIHHPLRVAADVATLDRLSGGRVLLGVGRGFQAPVFDAFGVSAARKRDRFDEALDALLRAFAGEPFRLEGTFFASVAGARVEASLAPVQRPHPPIVVAAFGRKGLLQAARRGLAYLASPLETLATLEENLAVWRAHLAHPPSPAGPAVPVMRTAFVAGDAAAAARVREALREDALRLRVGARTPAALVRAAGGELEDRAVVGTPGQVADTLARYRERLGMDLLVARTEVPGATEAERDASLERLAEVVART